MVTCSECEGILTGRRRKYCGNKCAKMGGRRLWVQKTYGISLDDYDAILAFQGGVCAICRRPPRHDEVLPIDHEHGGHVRGIVCHFCNTRLIGRLKDSERAQRLADYLREPPAVAALGRAVIAPGRPRKKRQPRKRKRA